MNYFKDNKKKIVICICIVALIPIVIQRLSDISAFSSVSNDWVGFWGSYIGAIVGACVALYVLVKTLGDNKKTQIRTEIIEFCNRITEKSSVFAQKYEESLYGAHTYLAVHELKTSLQEQEFGMYKQFVTTHHSAKAILYEIETYLSIRKDINIFYTPKLSKVQKAAKVAYNEFKEFESKVAKAEKLTDVDDKALINVVEEFLDVLNQYEKELLDKMVQENGVQMKTLKKIYNDAKEKVVSKKKEEIATYCMEILREEIGGNKAKLLVYKEECNRKVDFNLPVFWMTTLTMNLTGLSIIITIISLKYGTVKDITIILLCLISAFVLSVGIFYYQLVYGSRKKYTLMSLALDEIEKELEKKESEVK